MDQAPLPRRNPGACSITIIVYNRWCVVSCCVSCRVLTVEGCCWWLAELQRCQGVLRKADRQADTRRAVRHGPRAIRRRHRLQQERRAHCGGPHLHTAQVPFLSPPIHPSINRMILASRDFFRLTSLRGGRGDVCLSSALTLTDIQKLPSIEQQLMAILARGARPSPPLPVWRDALNFRSRLIG